MLHISLNKFHFIIFTLIRSYQRSHIFRMKYLNIASVNTLLDIHIHICINTHKIIFTDIFDEIFFKIRYILFFPVFIPFRSFYISRVKKRTKQRLIFSTKIYFSKQFIKQSQIIKQAFLVQNS